MAAERRRSFSESQSANCFIFCATPSGYGFMTHAVRPAVGLRQVYGRAKSREVTEDHILSTILCETILAKRQMKPLKIGIAGVRGIDGETYLGSITRYRPHQVSIPPKLGLVFECRALRSSTPTAVLFLSLRAAV